MQHNNWAVVLLHCLKECFFGTPCMIFTIIFESQVFKIRFELLPCFWIRSQFNFGRKLQTRNISNPVLPFPLYPCTSFKEFNLWQTCKKVLCCSYLMAQCSILLYTQIELNQAIFKLDISLFIKKVKIGWNS